LSPSVSQSLSPSLSPSLSESLSQSLSQSLSPSLSLSLSPSSSISPSPSFGYSDYTRGDYVVLPANDDDLETFYTEQEEIDVSASDNVRVEQTALSQYMIHQFKSFVGANTACEIKLEFQTSMDLNVSPAYLQIYNQNTATWETIDSDNSSKIDIDFLLVAKIIDLTNYKNASNVVSCRVYQLSTP